MYPGNYITAGIHGNLGHIDGKPVCRTALSLEESSDRPVSVILRDTRERRPFVCLHSLRSYKGERAVIRYERITVDGTFWLPTLGRVVKCGEYLTGRLRARLNRPDLAVMFFIPPEVFAFQDHWWQRLLGIYRVAICCEFAGGYYE